MNKIKKKIREIKRERRMGFMGHIVAGYPDIETSYQAAMGILQGGADFLEIQFPFSDPFADGPLLEMACKESLSHGMKIEDCFYLSEKICRTNSAPILIMTYANIIFKYGVEPFLNRAAAIGIQGIIVPDLPPENDEGMMEACDANNICPILLAAPGNTNERIKFLSEKGKGFLYTVSRSGVTGKRTSMDHSVQEWINRVKKNSKLPIAVGFGINTPDQIKAIKPYCDITIAGSFFKREIQTVLNEQLDIFTHLKKRTKWLLEQNNEAIAR